MRVAFVEQCTHVGENAVDQHTQGAQRVILRHALQEDYSRWKSASKPAPRTGRGVSRQSVRPAASTRQGSAAVPAGQEMSWVGLLAMGTVALFLMGRARLAGQDFPGTCGLRIVFHPDFGLRVHERHFTHGPDGIYVEDMVGDAKICQQISGKLSINQASGRVNPLHEDVLRCRQISSRGERAR